MIRRLAMGLFVLVQCALPSLSGAAPAAADAVPGRPGAAPLAARLSRSDEIRGRVVFNGCIVAPGQVKVRAVPIGVRTRAGAIRFPRLRSAIRRGKVSATADEHVLRFSIRNLHPRALYRIGISAPPAGCGKVFWRGPDQGLVLSGGRSVTLEGFSAQTELELFSVEADSWVGADNLDFDDPAASTRLLRWRSALPGVTGGELQLSTVPFPRQGSFGACDEPEAGIFHRQALQAPRGSEWQELDPLDFGTLLESRVGPAPEPRTTPITDRVRGTLLLGAPVYARVVPLVGGEPACDTRRQGVHGWVVAAKVPRGEVSVTETGDRPLEAWGGQSYAPPYLGQPAQGHPALGEIAYRVIREHTLPPKPTHKMTQKEWFAYAIGDPLGCGLVDSGMAKPGQTLTVGTWFYFVPQPKGDDGGDFISGFTSVLGGLATAAWSGFGDLVNYAAQITEEIKSSLASTVVDIASVVPGVPLACTALQSSTGRSCDDVVKAGMEYGMTSMGIPPSLPNFEQLQAEGLDYLAAEIATQIGDPTGLSEQFTEQMLTDLAQTTMDLLADSRPGVGANVDWVVPYNGFDPALWTLSLRKNVPDPLAPQTFVRVRTGNVPPLYLDANVHVPERFPAGGVLQVPVVLRPSPAGLDAPLCRYNRYTASLSCVPIPGATTPVCQYREYTKAGQYAWVGFDCSWTNYLSIYYRDAWVQQKLGLTQCFLLQGISAASTGGLWIQYPLPPYVAAAIVPAGTPSWWDAAVWLDPTCP